MKFKKKQKLDCNAICYIVMPEDHSSMVVYQLLADAQYVAKKLSECSGIKYDVYPGLSEVSIA